MSTELEILRSLESEAIEIFRETAASFSKSRFALLDRQGLIGTAALSEEGFLPGAYPI